MKSFTLLRGISGLALSVVFALGLAGFIIGETDNNQETRKAVFPALGGAEQYSDIVPEKSGPSALPLAATKMSGWRASIETASESWEIMMQENVSTFWFGYEVYRNRTFRAEEPGYYVLYSKWSLTQSNSTLAYAVILRPADGFYIKPLVGIDQNGRGHVHVRVSNPNLRDIRYLYSVDSVHRLASDGRSLEDVTLDDTPEAPFNSRNSVRAGNWSWFDRYFVADPRPADAFAYFFSLHPIGLRGEEVLTVEVFITLQLISREG